jgi:hypothetical protein
LKFVENFCLLRLFPIFLIENMVFTVNGGWSLFNEYWPLKLPALGRYLNILIDRYRVASQVCGVRLVIKSCMTLITRLPRSLHIVSEYIYYNRMSCTFLLSINKGTLLNASRLWNCYQVSTVLLSFFFSFSPQTWLATRYLSIRMFRYLPKAGSFSGQLVQSILAFLHNKSCSRQYLKSSVTKTKTFKDKDKKLFDNMHISPIIFLIL